MSKTNKKRLISLMLSLILASSLTFTVFSYDDSGGHWAENYIDIWSNAGVLSGVGANFRPDDPITRAEFAESLHAIFGNKWAARATNRYDDIYGTVTPSPGGALQFPGNNTITDRVPARSVDALLRAQAAGVITGTVRFDTVAGQPNRPIWTIDPHGYITRAEAAVMLCRAFNIPGSMSSGLFADESDIPTEALTYVIAMREAEYFLGVGDDIFNPSGYVTRAQILAVYERMSGDIDWLAVRRANTAAIVEHRFPNSGNLAADISGQPANTFMNVIVGQTQRFDGTYKDIAIRFYRPENTTGAPVPLLIYIHGGGWTQGNPAWIEAAVPVGHPLLLETCLRNGIAVASLTYSLATEATFPTPLHELKAQIRFLRLHAEAFGIDPDNIGVFGHSAGGYYAALIAATGDSVQHEGALFNDLHNGLSAQSSAVQYAVINYGGVDLMNMFNEIDPSILPYSSNLFFHDSQNSAEAMVFGSHIHGFTMRDLRRVRELGDTDHELWPHVLNVKLGTPINFIDSNAPPVFIVHNTEDKFMSIGQAVSLYGALRNAGVEATLAIASHTDHLQEHPKIALDTLDWVLWQALERKPIAIDRIDGIGPFVFTNTEPLEVRISNVDYYLEEHYIISMSGGSASSFTVTQPEMVSLTETYFAATFTVAPRADLAAGTHIETVTVTNIVNGAVAVFTVKFIVNN